MRCAFWKRFQTEQLKSLRISITVNRKIQSSSSLSIKLAKPNTFHYSTSYLLVSLWQQPTWMIGHQPDLLISLSGSALASIFAAHLKNVAVLHSKQPPYIWCVSASEETAFPCCSRFLGSRGLSHLAHALGRSLLTSLGELALFTDFNCN